MATGIEWTNETWNPVSGCTRVTAGCDNCYAVGQTYRCECMGQGKYAGLTVLDKRGRRRFNGVVRCHEKALAIPLKWKKGKMIFVNSMSDLFHKDVPLEFVKKVFDVIRRCPQHVFQVLTKRPERVAELDADLDWPDNLWMGVTVEDNSVVHRIDLLRDECRAKMKWLSIEPLIGPIPGLCLLDIDWVVGGDSSNAGPPSCGEPDNHISQDKQMDHRPARKSFRAVRCPALVVESAGAPPSGRLETCGKRGTEASRTWRCAIAPSAMRTAFSIVAGDGSCQRTVPTKVTSGASYRTPSGEDRSIRRTPAPTAPDAALSDGLSRGPPGPLRRTFDRRERGPPIP